MAEDKAPTHTAFALKREGKKFGRWLEIGNARIEDGGIGHIFIDRTPVGGFNGYVYLSPNGVKGKSPLSHKDQHVC